MHTARRDHGVPPLAIVLPHPPLPRRRSSLLSSSSAPSEPRTPRTGRSPVCSAIFFSNPNRKSTDSWNSSNPPDEIEIEWKQEHTLLLARVCLRSVFFIMIDQTEPTCRPLTLYPRTLSLLSLVQFHLQTSSIKSLVEFLKPRAQQNGHIPSVRLASNSWILHVFAQRKTLLLGLFA